MQDIIRKALDDKHALVESARRDITALIPFNVVETPLKRISTYGFKSLAPGTICRFVELEPERADEGLALVQEILRLLELRQAHKSFNEYDGTVRYVMEKEGTRVIIVGTPPRCEVESYETEDFVPARVVRSRKFRLKNPEECLGQSQKS